MIGRSMTKQNLLVTFLFIVMPFGVAQADDFTCANYDFSFAIHNGKFDHTYDIVIAMSHDTVGYASAESDEITKKLRFGDRLYVMSDPENNARANVKLVSNSSEDDPSWWVNRDDLLCADEPLYNNKHKVLRRAYAKVISQHGGPSSARAYKNINDIDVSAKCDGSHCQLIRRFSLQFIWGEKKIGKETYYLTSPSFGNRSRIAFSGWVNANDVIEWNSAIGFQPIADPSHPKYENYVPSDSVRNSEFFLCGYANKDQLEQENRDDCAEIYATYSWFKSPNRMPLLDSGEVTFSGGNTKKFIKTAVSSTGTPSTHNSSAQLDAFKHLDVIFVIDGTASMDKAFEAIKGDGFNKGALEKINDELSLAMRDFGGSYRAGFQIYRDTVYDNDNNRLLDDGLGRSYIQNDASCETGWTEGNQGFENFRKAFAQVQARDREYVGFKDDFHENSYGGIVRAIELAAESCPQRLKMFILIGDHGYNSSVQQQDRGGDYFNTSQISQWFDEAFALPPQLTVIQMPKNNKYSGLQAQYYDKAYDDFQTQGQQLINQHSANLNNDNFNRDDVDRLKKILGLKTLRKPSEQFKQFTNAHSIEYMSNTIADIAKGAVVFSTQLGAQIKTGIVNGTLPEVIVEIQENNQYDIMPAFLLPSMVMEACRQVSMAVCEGNIDAVAILYIPEKYVEEPYQNIPGVSQNNNSNNLTYPVLLEKQVWVIDKEFKRWTDFLTKVSQYKGVERIKSFSTTFEEAFKNILKLDAEGFGDETYLEIVKDSRLPLISKSPLMHYSGNSLLNVADCEIELLDNYIRNKLSAFEILQRGDVYPKLVGYQESACSLSKAGKGIPNVTQDNGYQYITPDDIKPSERSDYSFRWKTEGPSKSQDVYWIPMRFMP